MNLPPGALTVWGYAARRGTSSSAVRERIEAGKLPTSTKRHKGRWVIVDPEKADAEWAANTRPWVRSETASPGRGSPLAAAILRERQARAVGLEFENARRRGDFVSAATVAQRWSALVVEARTAMLGIPSRAKGRLPHLTAADLAVIDGLIREALVELAEAPVRTGRVAGIRNTRPRAGVSHEAHHAVDHNGGPPTTSPTRTVGESGDRP